MSKLSKISERLIRAQSEKLIVSFSRPFEDGRFTGFAMDVGAKFFVLASFNDAFEFDQFVCLRIKDVRRLQAPAKHAAFYVAARKLRGDKLPRKIGLDLTDATSILRSVNNSIVAIYREELEPESCNIGIGLSDNRKHFEMLEIDPDAKWDETPTYFRLKDITRIDLPGPYERALLAVGGEPRLPAPSAK